MPFLGTMISTGTATDIFKKCHKSGSLIVITLEFPSMKAKKAIPKCKFLLKKNNQYPKKKASFHFTNS